MSFISFNEKYYRQTLQRLENKNLTEDDIYEAKQLLKVLDDLADEGYTALNDYMESGFSCLTRLRRIIRSADREPFELNHDRLPKTAYGAKEYELSSLTDALRTKAAVHSSVSVNPFLARIRDYCDWIGYDTDTAYIFLFRDSLLPYMYFRSKGRKNIYPWLLNRGFLNDLTGVKDADDEIRLPLYEALENGYTSFKEFNAYCGEKILSALSRHTELKNALSELLCSVKEKRIIVIESGYMGTFPMMLRALDDRVSFTLYTTAPFLFETYKDQCFCKRYEENRTFETLYSQDIILKYSSFRDGKFYVNMSEADEAIGKALAEIKYFMS